MRKDLTIIAGYTFSQPFQIIAIDEADIEYNYDLTNCTITAVAKPSANSCKSYPFTIEITNALEGRFVISMPASLTDTISETRLLYDIKVADNANDNVFRATFGDIQISKEITP